MQSATNHQEYIDARSRVVEQWHIRREQGLFGYDSVLARLLSDALDEEPGLDLVSAHCGSHPDIHTWGLRVIANGYPPQKVARLQRLEPGPHGGVL